MKLDNAERFDVIDQRLYRQKWNEVALKRYEGFRFD
jgi:hypothetical protein